MIGRYSLKLGHLSDMGVHMDTMEQYEGGLLNQGYGLRDLWKLHRLSIDRTIPMGAHQQFRVEIEHSAHEWALLQHGI